MQRQNQKSKSSAGVECREGEKDTHTHTHAHTASVGTLAANGRQRKTWPRCSAGQYMMWHEEKVTKNSGCSK